MYLLHFDSSGKEKLIRDIFSCEAISSVYEALNNDKYDIYFKIGEDDEKISYCALNREGNEPIFLSFSVSGNKEIVDYDPHYCNNIPYSEALALYILEKDNKANEETLKRRYDKYYSVLEPLANLSKQKADQFFKAKSSLDALKTDLLADFLGETKKRLKIDFSIFRERGHKFSLQICAGVERRMAAKDLPAFFSSLLANEPLVLGRKDNAILHYDIEEDDRMALAFLSSRLSYKYGNDLGFLNDSDFVSFLFFLSEKTIDFETNSFLIKSPIEAKVSIGENGEIILSSPINKDDIVLFNDKKCIVIDLREKEIRLLTFASSSEATLCRFSVLNKDFPYGLLADEFGKSIVPLLGRNTKVDDRFLALHQNGNTEIHYSISYSDTDDLECATHFYLGLREIDEDTFKKSNSVNCVRYEKFQSELKKLSLPQNGVVSDQDLILAFLYSDLKALGDSCKLFLSDDFVNEPVRSLESIRIETKSGEDWFSLSLESDKYSKEELDKIFLAYKKHKKFVHLRGNFIILGEEEIVPLTRDFSPQDLGRKLPFYEVFKLNRSSNDVSLSESLVKMIRDISCYQDFSLSGLNESLKKTLRPYQADGVRWLLSHDKYRLGGILADEMGLGKTLETIAFLSLSKEEEPILIVSPKSLVYNWESEFHRFDPSREVEVVVGNVNDRNKAILRMKNSKRTVFIISYDSLRNDIEKIKDIRFSYLFLDEAQFIANAFAKKTKAVKMISSNHRFVLTGTPIQNSLLDLWSIFDFLLPGYFPSFKDFKLEYGGFEYADEKSEMRLRYRIQPFILKRTKKDVLKELPPKEEKQMIVALNEEQRKLYESYLMKARQLLRGTKEHKESTELDRKTNKLVILSAITRLREICVDPSIFLDTDTNSEKILTLIDSIKTGIYNGHKILIFSSFAKALFHIEKILSSFKIDSYFIYGDTPAKARIEMAQAFNTLDDTKVMLVSLKAGGTGLNLVGADLVYHLDPWWNVASEDQASDRAHRLGQKRKVTIFKMIAKNTIEEKVVELQTKKKNLTTILANGDPESLKGLTDEDIAYLLS